MDAYRQRCSPPPGNLYPPAGPRTSALAQALRELRRTPASPHAARGGEVGTSEARYARALRQLVAPRLRRHLLVAPAGARPEGRGAPLAQRMLEGPQPAAAPLPLRELGALLAAVHGSPLDRPEAAPLPRGTQALARLGFEAWDVSGVLGELYRCLDACEELHALSTRACHLAVTQEVLLHGCWSSELLLCAAGRAPVSALGGTHAWIGPAEFDLGYLVGELCELATLRWLDGAEAALRSTSEAVGAFLTGYCASRFVDARVLTHFVAHRLVSRLAAALQQREALGLPALASHVLVGLLAAFEQLVRSLEQTWTLPSEGGSLAIAS